MPKKFNPTPNVDTRYGAPMGRPNRDTIEGGSLHGQKITVTDNARPFRLVRIPLNGGYDRGGAYWGIGASLWYFEGPVSDISGYVRGRTRDMAKAAVRNIHPLAKFYR